MPPAGRRFGSPWRTDGTLVRRVATRSSCEAPPRRCRRCFDAPVVAASALGSTPDRRAVLADARRCRLSPSVCFLTMSISSWRVHGRRRRGPRVLPCAATRLTGIDYICKCPLEQLRNLDVRQTAHVLERDERGIRDLARERTPLIRRRQGVLLADDHHRGNIDA